MVEEIMMQSQYSKSFFRLGAFPLMWESFPTRPKKKGMNSLGTSVF